MYDIKPLEKEWKKYKKKKRRPWLILLFFLFVLLVILFIFLNYKEITFPKFDDPSKVEKVISKNPILLIDKALNTLEIKKTKLKSRVVTSYENGSMDIVEDMPIEEDINRGEKPRINITTIEKPTTSTIEKPRKKMHLDIVETTSVSAYKDVAKRFKQTHDTDDSLFLAKSYYSKGNYKKAEYWALQTNKVNGNIEESWLIFAQAKLKLGRKNEAIGILTAYIKKSNSLEAKKLLYKIQKGTR